MELRYEYKYIVPVSKQDELRKMLSPFVLVDDFALGRPNNEYTVRSIYFDTPDFQFYHEKIEGLSYRKKVRLRGYNTINGSNPVFMEIKSKHQIPLHKTRAKTTYEKALESFETGDLYKVVNDITKHKAEANQFMYQILAKKLKPVVLVIYEREPFTEKVDTSNRLRITFDKNLRSSAFPSIGGLYDENNIKKSLPGFFILEVKFNDYYPAWMKSIIATLQLKNQSASKYVISIDAHQMVTKYSRYHVIERKFT